MTGHLLLEGRRIGLSGCLWDLKYCWEPLFFIGDFSAYLSGDDVIGVLAGDSWRFKNAYKLFTEAFVLCYFVSVFFDAGFHSNQQKTIQQCSVWIWDSSEYCYSCSIISVSTNRWILYEF